MIIDKIRIGNTSYDIGVDYSNVDGTPTKLSDFTNDEGFIDKNVNDLTNYTPSSQTTSQLELVLNSENYKLKGILKDSTGSTIYTSNEIDLPLESVVVSGTYDSQTKEVVLTLVNGSTIRFSVADLVSGLVSSTDLATALANYYTKNEVNGLLANKQDIVQYSTMPTASESLLGKIVQYVGTDTQNYTNGYWYKCVVADNVYSWLEISGGSGSVDIDNTSITENTSGEIQTVGVIDQNTSNTDKIWTGTLAQYNSLVTKDSDTYYCITDDEENIYRENVEVITSADTSYTITNLTANKSYKLGELTTLTITACETFDEETVIYFDSGSTATVLSMPNDVVLIGDEIEADKSYIIAILNKIAVIKGYEVE